MEKLCYLASSLWGHHRCAAAAKSYWGFIRRVISLVPLFHCIMFFLHHDVNAVLRCARVRVMVMTPFVPGL